MEGTLLLPPRAAAPAGRVESVFSALRIEGGLFPAEFLQTIAAERAPGQTASEYGIPPGRTLRDEIGRYWTIADALWREYRRDQPRTDLDPQRVGVERWLLRLLRDVLGYTDITKTPLGAYVGERGFPITHRAHDGTLPLVLTVASRDLDRAHVEFGDEGRRRAPHATIQEYLNAEPGALWGVVSNGVKLRLLRDNPSLTRPAYVEADLERIFEEGLYPDFAALWLIAHASRTAPGAEGVAACWLETWRAVGAETGQRALAQLRQGVTQALRELGSGFVEHPDNDTLRAALNDGSLTPEGLHQQLLRLVYRLLFLFTAEERGLLHAPDASAEARALYAHGYGLGRLRERARRRRHYDGHADLWTGLTVAFCALARGAPPLGLPALGGLFEESQCDRLDAASLSNRRLLAAIHALAFFTDRGALQRVNYRDMGTEELGSVYESLLELHPVVQVATRPWSFAFAGDEASGAVKGSERKLSGSYYTPDSLVQELLRSALDPVIERAIRDNPADPRGALLRLRVLDPACGSGHFLLGAARRLADALARLDMEGDLPDEAVRRRALREVVRRCIFGVDRNPLSVELCRTALWIEAIEPGRPLSFLDAHIKCGDSLIGVADPSVLKAGIPDEAFKELTGDDPAYARELRRRNRGERENPTLSLLPEVALPKDLAAAIGALTEAPEDTLAAVEAKRRGLREAMEGRAAHDLRVACDLWCAAFFAPKATPPEFRGRDLVPTTDTVWRYLRAPSSVYGPLVGAVEELRGRLRFFHWPLEFPEALAAGGFDCVLGNPPWERIKLQEQEFFAARDPAIAEAPNAAARRRLIEALKIGDDADRTLYRAFEEAKRDAEAASQFVRGCGRFPLTAVGDVNTYALFAEAFLRLPNGRGHAGLIVPTGIATDDSTKAFFEAVAGGGRLASLYDFENREGLFPAVDSRMKFALLTLGSGEAAARFVFFATRVEHLADARRAFTLTAEDIRLINPNTRTCPVFRSSADAELTKRIYARVPVLVDETKGKAGNPWGISFMAMFHMSNDSGLFRTAAQLAEAGFHRDGPDWVRVPAAAEGRLALAGGLRGDELPLAGGGPRPAERYVPLYEAKMIHHFDHRWATYTEDGDTSRDTTLAEKADPAFTATPRYWVPQTDVAERLSPLPKEFKAALREGAPELVALLVAQFLLARRLVELDDLGALKGEQGVFRQWTLLVGEHPALRGVAPTRLGLVGNNPPMLRPSGDNCLPAEPIDQISATDRLTTAWYAVDATALATMLDAARERRWLREPETPLEDEARLLAFGQRLLIDSCPKWLMGWRDITNATNERTVIAAACPRLGTGDTLLLMFPSVEDRLKAALIASLCSLPGDYVARQKVGGTHLKYHVFKQLAVLPPSAYPEPVLAFLLPRILELTYTAEDMRPWADDLGYTGPPFAWDEDRRAKLRAELDAAYARLYGLSRDELRYILDPADIHGADFPSETFRVLKEKEIRQHGEYRTARLVLAAWDRFVEDGTFRAWGI